MSRKSEKQQVTFMIVPHGKSKTISLQFSMPQMKLLGYLLIIALVIGIGLLADYIRIQQSHQQLQTEKKALTDKIGALNLELSKDKMDVSTLKDQVDEIKTYVKQLESLETEFRNKSGSLSLPSNENVSNGEEGGSGGAERLSPDSPVIAEDQDTAAMIKDTTHTLLVLNQEIPDKVKKVQHLIKDVDLLNVKLIHTPSIFPAVGTITSRFGYRRDPFNGATRFHDGFDIAAFYHAPILAAADGRVVFADRKQGYGKTIQIVHSQKLQTSYSHLSEIAVAVGDSVKKGQVIGYMGSTGRSTGVHIHYMVYENGRPIDPEKYLPKGRK